MDHHFRSFSFVDRILAIEPGVRISGTYAIPGEIEGFPISLVAEATGQLAAWSAMAALDFSHRPVAGIAGRVEMLGSASPGDTLELAAELHSADVEAVAYGGRASVNGTPVLRLEFCVGPMMPLETFDDPALVRARFAVLCGEGAEGGIYRGVPTIQMEDLTVEDGRLARAKLHVPEEAAFFRDHFPKRPVFPGSLLMNYNLQLVDALVASLPPALPGKVWKPRAVVDMKLREFIVPGEHLTIEAKVMRQEGDMVKVSLETRNATGRMGAARVELVQETSP